MVSSFPLRASELDGERAEWSARVERARREYETFAARAWEHFAARRVDAFAPQRTQPPASYAQDTTLRRGDCVMTNHGFVVFAGDEEGQPRFKALGEWRGPSPHRADLLELERAAETSQ